MLNLTRSNIQQRQKMAQWRLRFLWPIEVLVFWIACTVLASPGPFEESQESISAALLHGTSRPDLSSAQPEAKRQRLVEGQSIVQPELAVASPDHYDLRLEFEDYDKLGLDEVLGSRSLAGKGEDDGEYGSDSILHPTATDKPNPYYPYGTEDEHITYPAACRSGDTLTHHHPDTLWDPAESRYLGAFDENSATASNLIWTPWSPSNDEVSSTILFREAPDSSEHPHLPSSATDINNQPPDQTHSITIQDNPIVQEHLAAELGSRPFPLDMSPPTIPVKSEHRFVQSLDDAELNLIDRYVSSFKGRVDEVVNKYKNFSCKMFRDNFDNLPVALVSLNTKTSPELPPLIRVVKASGNFRIPQEMVKLWTQLINQLCFYHKAFRRHLFRTKTFRKRTHKKILSWLYEEFFNPPDSLPVFETVNKRISAYDQRAFGPTQLWLIEYLSSGENSYLTSISIIGIWYKNYEKTIWQANFPQDDVFWSFTVQAIKSARHSPLTLIDKRRYVTPIIWASLGDFVILDPGTLETISHGRIPLKPKMTERVKSAPEYMGRGYQSIVDCWKSICPALYEHSHHKDKNFQELLVTVTFSKDMADGNYYIRFLEDNNEIMDLKKVEKKLLSFVKALASYNEMFRSFMLLKGRDFPETAQEELMIWLKTQLFSPEKSIPVFGKFPENDKNLTLSMFGMIQIYLVEYFTRRETKLESDHAVFSVLGYWYKMNFKEFWMSQFGDDMKYWKFIAETAVCIGRDHAVDFTRQR